MIVRRQTFRAKPGRQTDVVALLKAQPDNPIGPYRIFISYVGGFGSRVIVDWEYENEAQHEKLWAEWYARPETAAFGEKFYALVDEWQSELLTVQ